MEKNEYIEYKDIIDDIANNKSIDLRSGNSISEKSVTLARLLEGNRRADILYFITDLMNENNIDITDIMDVMSYDPDSVLDNLNEYDISDYCTRYHLYEEDDDVTTSDDPDKNIINYISEYCHLKHKLCDFDTVIEDIKEVLTMHGYDKKLL